MIKIINDFFNEKQLHLVQDFTLNKATYTPCFFDNAKERNKYTHYGNRFNLSTDKELKNLFINQAELKFDLKNLKINDNISGIDQRNLDHFKPHTDTGIGIISNILIMISGPTAVTNGTVFYSDNELDIHVGFKENRAVMFPPDWLHSQHASTVPNLKRYTATLFCNSYEKNYSEE
tara:strand:+ start:732 stop:1259 length:528 start_codon:yes stop_codon:yes gene_type:complete